MKRLGIAIILLVIVNNLFGQQDLFVGSSYQLSLQRQNTHGDAWILHNAEFSQDSDLLKWKTTHSSFGARGIRFNYGSGIYFYADNNSTVSGTNFNPTTRFFIGNNGNVGIGTIIPALPLHIEAANTPGIIIQRNDNAVANGVIRFRGNDNLVDGEIAYNNAVGSAMSFSTGAGGASVRMSIMNDGKVGIGTTLPAGNLDIVGGSGQLLISENITDATIKYNRIGVKHYTIAEEPFYGIMMAASSTANDLRLGGGTSLGNAASIVSFYLAANNTTTSGTEVARMTTTGLGLGTTSPGYKLDVAGNFRATLNTYLATTSGNNVGIGTTTPTAKLDIYSASDNLFRVFNSTTGQDNDRLNIKILDNQVTFLTDGSTTAPNILFKLFNNDALYISSTGIGIGTTTPQNKLDVAGVIRCAEVKVEALPWADFVFHPSYKLRTLGEVEQFIKVNNHLPEIPTESEVKQNGIGLGEMNAKLLQKIEELTLYMIEQQKVNEKQNQLIKELETKIEKIANKQ